MKKFFLILPTALALLGAGCTTNPPSIPATAVKTTQPNKTSAPATTEQTTKDFDLKSKCAPYISKKQQLLSQVQTESAAIAPDIEVFSRGCYSKKYNTCVAFLETIPFSSRQDHYDRYLAVDLLAGDNLLDFVDLLGKNESDRLNMKILLEDGVDCL